MQRMLVALVVLLVGAVGVLAVTTYNLHEEVSLASARTSPEPAATRGVTVTEAADSTRVRTLEGEVRKLQDELRILREQLVTARREALAARRAPPDVPGDGSREGGAGDGPAGAYPEPGAPRLRDADGGFLITEEDEDYFIAVQDRVQHRRRIEGMTRNVMRRVERLASRGEIAPLADDRRDEVEKILRKYVVKGDDLVSSYVREPDELIRTLTPEQRRDQLAAERADLVAAAQRDLVPLIGEADAAKIAEESLENPWGLRRGTGLRGSRADR